MQNKFGIRISNGGATGAYTMSAAHAYVAAGRFKVALVLGVEKATDCFDFQSMSATPEVIKTNPYAQRQFDQVTPEEVMNSRMVAWPFKELEICVYSEGAAALIVAEEETAKAISRNTGQPVVWITGVGESNEHSFAGKNQKVMSRIMSDYYSSHQAYDMAGIKDPTEAIDIVELHDAFVHQLEISCAEFGLVPLGRGDALIEDGLMTPGGRYVVNPCGGLIYSGHAVGASNIMSAWSARNELINRGLKTALVHGTGSTVAQYGACLVFEHD